MSSPVQGSVEGSAQSPAQDPVHGDPDAQQPTLADRTDEAETQRLHHEVVEAVQRMEREATERVPETAFQLLPNNTVSFRIPVVRRAVERPGRGQTNERVWSALRTEFLTPPQRGWGVPGIAIVAGSIGAVILAAAIALLVANLVQIPPPAVTASGEDEAARNESFSSAAVNLSRIAATQAKMQPADDEPQAAPTGVALATAGRPTTLRRPNRQSLWPRHRPRSSLRRSKVRHRHRRHHHHRRQKHHRPHRQQHHLRPRRPEPGQR